MKHLHTSLIKSDSAHWFFFLLTGVLLITTGLYCLVFPLYSAVKISHVIATLALLIGIAKIVFSLKNKIDLHHWKWHFLAGVSLIAVSPFLFLLNGISYIMIPFLLGFWIVTVFVSLLEETTDLQLFHTSDFEWLIVAGIVTIVMILVVAYMPILGSLTIIIWTAASFMIVGIFYIYLSIRLRIVKNRFLL